MLVDIVIPVYNGEQCLSGCLDSVLGQSYHNWRAIIIDDGSTDKSGAVADAYAEKDSRFTVIHQCNEGQYYARMRGIQESEGEILMFLDSDDRWIPECLEKLTNTFAKHNADIVMFPAMVIPEDGHPAFKIGNGFEKEGFLVKRDVCEVLLTSNDLNSLWLKAFKRDLFDVEELKKTAHKKARMGEDKIMQLPVFTEAREIYYLDECLYLYTYSTNSISHHYDASKISTMMASEMFDEVNRYKKIWGMDNKAISTRVDVYKLRHVMSCFGKIRKGCATKGDVRTFRAYPWKRELQQGSAYYLFGKDLTIREKAKLLSMMICVEILGWGTQGIKEQN